MVTIQDMWNKALFPSCIEDLIKVEISHDYIGCIEKCIKILSGATYILEDHHVLGSDLYVLSRYLLRRKAQLRRHKVKQALSQVQSCLKRYKSSDYTQAVKKMQHYFQTARSSHQSGRVVELPSQGMVQHFLVRLMGMTALLAQTVNYCVNASFMLQTDVRLGHLLGPTMMCHATVSRIWACVRCLYMESVSWYDALRVLLPVMPSGALWLSENDSLPVDLASWLRERICMDNIERTPQLVEVPEEAEGLSEGEDMEGDMEVSVDGEERDGEPPSMSKQNMMEDIGAPVTLSRHDLGIACKPVTSKGDNKQVPQTYSDSDEEVSGRQNVRPSVHPDLHSSTRSRIGKTVTGQMDVEMVRTLIKQLERCEFSWEGEIIQLPLKHAKMMRRKLEVMAKKMNGLELFSSTPSVIQKKIARLVTRFMKSGTIRMTQDVENNTSTDKTEHTGEEPIDMATASTLDQSDPEASTKTLNNNNKTLTSLKDHSMDRVSVCDVGEFGSLKKLKLGIAKTKDIQTLLNIFLELQPKKIGESSFWDKKPGTFFIKKLELFGENLTKIKTCKEKCAKNPNKQSMYMTKAIKHCLIYLQELSQINKSETGEMDVKMVSCLTKQLDSCEFSWEGQTIRLQSKDARMFRQRLENLAENMNGEQPFDSTNSVFQKKITSLVARFVKRGTCTSSKTMNVEDSEDITEIRDTASTNKKKKQAAKAKQKKKKKRPLGKS